MSNHAFIRGLWGELDGPRYNKIFKDVERAIEIDKNLDTVTYVMGQKNYDYLTSNGLNCVLLNKNPVGYHKYMWRHKLDIYAAAMSDFNEIIYLDWDCNLINTIPPNFWNTLELKEPIQGCLYKWSSGKPCPWRKEKYLINNGFLYFCDKSIPQDIIKLYDSLPHEHKWRKNDEFVTSYYIDNLTGGWKGLDYWLQHYEPTCCYYSKGIFKKSKVNPIFQHYKTSLSETGEYSVI